MMRQLVVNNVLHRPIRTIVSVIAVGVEVALVILIVGLTSGLLQETAKRMKVSARISCCSRRRLPSF